MSQPIPWWPLVTTLVIGCSPEAGDDAAILARPPVKEMVANVEIDTADGVERFVLGVASWSQVAPDAGAGASCAAASTFSLDAGPNEDGGSRAWVIFRTPTGIGDGDTQPVLPFNEKSFLTLDLHAAVVPTATTQEWDTGQRHLVGATGLSWTQAGDEVSFTLTGGALCDYGNPDEVADDSDCVASEVTVSFQGPFRETDCYLGFPDDEGWCTNRDTREADPERVPKVDCALLP